MNGVENGGPNCFFFFRLVDSNTWSDDERMSHIQHLLTLISPSRLPKQWMYPCTIKSLLNGSPLWDPLA